MADVGSTATTKTAAPTPTMMPPGENDVLSCQGHQNQHSRRQKISFA